MIDVEGVTICKSAPCLVYCRCTLSSARGSQKERGCIHPSSLVPTQDGEMKTMTDFQFPGCKQDALLMYLHANHPSPVSLTTSCSSTDATRVEYASAFQNACDKTTYKTRDRQHIQRAQLNIRVRDEQQVENTDGMTGHGWSNQKVRRDSFAPRLPQAPASSLNTTAKGDFTPRLAQPHRRHQRRQVNRGLQHPSWGLRISRTSTNTTNELCREYRFHGTL